MKAPPSSLLLTYKLPESLMTPCSPENENSCNVFNIPFFLLFVVELKCEIRFYQRGGQVQSVTIAAPLFEKNRKPTLYIVVTLAALLPSFLRSLAQSVTVLFIVL